MKKITALLVLVISIFVMSAGVSAADSFALCMGLSKCNARNYKDITAAQNDAIDFKKVLAKQGYKASVVTNKYATRANILSRIRNIVAATKSKDDRIVLFFATHGSEKGYLLTYGGEFIEYREIIDILSRSKTRHIYIFVMACYSGTVTSGLTSDPNWQNSMVKSGITFMVSCRPDETSKSINMAHWKHSVFGQALIKGLRGMSDTNSDRKITLLELYQYVYREVVGRMNGSTELGGETQHPQLIGPSSEHNTVLARW